MKKGESHCDCSDIRPFVYFIFFEVHPAPAVPV